MTNNVLSESFFLKKLQQELSESLEESGLTNLFIDPIVTILKKNYNVLSMSFDFQTKSISLTIEESETGKQYTTSVDI